jgi:hypothetical protein
LNADRPDWAFTWEQRADGKTIFRDGGGLPLVALAVTKDELHHLESGLQLLPQSKATLALLDRLAGLREDLDGVAE